ncbi:ATP-binding protein [Microbispora sp. NBC_01189]|uniref:ATP-binding protein n=1 Tax=Microbispora sp. NBC_01189 TaxID=2903583 RepID=UPI002E12ADDC|nr:ATP-binding protein [Microbispora sp. NBC_01189]
MGTVHIEAKPDHLLRLARQRDPVGAVVEMIWNALDAEASLVNVDLEINELDGVESVSIEDDGHGMPNASCRNYFGGLGGSWKTAAKVSPRLKRGLHGRSGQGRLRAFSLGGQVRWITIAEAADGRIERTVISGTVDRPADFDISEPEPVRLACGTRVEASVPADFVSRLTQDDTAQQLASTFAPFLAANPDVRIVYQGVPLDPATVWTGMAEYPLRWPDSDGHPAPLLRVIEWPKDVGRVLALCDASGVVLDEPSPGIQAPGYHFTAYLLWDGFVERRDDLPLAETDEIAPLLALAREKLRAHFKRREQERRVRLVQEWKTEGVYPYAAGPSEPAQAVEREMFDEVAARIARRLPGATQSKKTTLRLLREVISRDPSGLYPVLDELFRLPQSEQEELKRILQRTSLAEVIRATGQITDRLDFLAALKKLVFEPEVSRTLRERSELHRIVERETWIFGDAHALMISDQSLDAVLLRHLKELGREPVDGRLNPVRREDGRTGIVDLLLARVRRGGSGREHLVVELKAPRVRIGQAEVAQIKSYAEAIVSDPQFRDARVSWDFWVVSTEMSEVVRRDAAAPNRPPGCIAEWEGGVRIWARTWSEIIDDCEARLHFYQDRLNHDPAAEHAVEYLQRVHGEVAPATVTA